MWILAAVGAAFFAGLVAILAKLGIRTTDSDVATAIRTGVVLVMAWGIAAATGVVGGIGAIAPRTWLFLVLSGLATGGSWICYFKALQTGDVNKVVPIDKSSAVLASLLAIVLFAETAHLALRLLCIAVILVGTWMMIERRDAAPDATADGRRPAWLVYAVLAALFAALTAILGKVGIDGVDSTLGTAIRTVVVLVMAWAIVLGKGKAAQVRGIDRRQLAFLVLSGLATGASWLCYYYALQTGVVSAVVQIDKLSVLVSIAFAWAVFGERLTPKAGAGLALMVAGTAVLALL